MRFKLVYGKYGRSGNIPINSPLVHTTDNMLLLKYGLESLGHQVDFEHGFAPGYTNIIMENFTYDTLEEMKEAVSTKDTRFIIVATEFLTGDTFNDFGTCIAGTDVPMYENLAYWKKRYNTSYIARPTV